MPRGTSTGGSLKGWGEGIAVISINGVISGDDYAAGGASAPSIMEQLSRAKDDPAVKAVLLRINSPGGSASASQEIGDEVRRLREAGKKVVVSMGDTAASGGYWIACNADYIVANPATLTGSIGVIMQFQNLEELYRKIGIKTENITSGPHKDMGSAARPLTPAERDILKAMVNDIYQQFVQVVAQGRKMSEDKVRSLADGRVFTGRQAKELGLVDALGNFYDALNYASKLAGISGEPRLIYYRRPSPLSWLYSFLGSTASRLEQVVPSEGWGIRLELPLVPKQP
ncbi:MAG: signal peptide peptidase SppA [Clostridia bacterium]|nr:signal peptide peptidase SppA [Clostridia bacterium]